MEKESNDVFKKYKKQMSEAIDDLKTKGRRHRQIPNILTTMRLTAPCFIIPAAIVGNIPFIIISVAALGLTDLVDGFIARQFKLTSELGKDLDALADKIFAGTLLLASSIANPTLLINVGLEMAIAGINARQKLSGGETSSSLIGKAKTWALFALAGVGIVSPALGISNLLNPLMIATTAMQTLTIGSYLLKYGKDSKKQTVDSKQDLSNETNEPKEEESKEEPEKTKEKELISEGKTSSKIEQLREMKEILILEKNNSQDNDVPIQKIIK